MAEKTIPELTTLTEIDEFTLFIVDTGTQTFRINAGDLASSFFRDAILPAGITQPYAGTTPPTAWLLCDGSAISRSTYARLFAAIGTTYGTGDGSTTFNLPDLRGRVIAGRDDMGGAAASRITNGVAGFQGTTLGAAGGSQSYTPAGTNGGSQSIAHTHTIAHTHNFAHVHMSARRASTTGILQGLDAASTSSVAISGDPNIASMTNNISAQNGTGTSLSLHERITSGSLNFYTTGVISAPSGSGSTATTGAASATNSGGMSASATVNGSNFTFTGTASHRVQPTIIMNYIIKT